MKIYIPVHVFVSFDQEKIFGVFNHLETAKQILDDFVKKSTFDWFPYSKEDVQKNWEGIETNSILCYRTIDYSQLLTISEYELNQVNYNSVF